jgi:alkylation response protein AidB-like acyl-CoA dehydrogenase
MDFRLNEDQISLQKAARDFLSKESTPDVVRSAFESPDGDAPELYKKMADLGWLGVAVPERHGGLGLGLVEQAVLLEEMGYVDAPGAYFSTACMAIPALLAFDAGDLLPPLIEGSVKATLVQDPRFVLDGGIADAFVAARGEEVVWVERAEAEVTPHKTVDGTRRTASVSIPDGSGRELGRAADLGRVIDSATALLCAESVGGMQKALDMTVAYVKERQQFGRTIGSFQAIKHRLAEALVKVESSRSAAYYAAWANQAGSPDASYATSVAKAYSSEAFLSVAGEAIQLHGGLGYTWEHDSHLWFKRAAANSELLGSPAYHRRRALELSGQTADV